ncbi:dihydrolipoamide dehydrogenase [Alkaliphilus metalliredigens QYMF]|uniref:Dihydrolipoyl dehydrogenase n=1 Tax=Alkaliphilus metalliredigens (strain QYMF) TaxID=293826 RepID=A6TMP2_ALKMQ|nr:dihydrolipoyl dehydrogenase [Alkaliphilus metalliredigens]ABR47460.1 dihydrolipoamide dehydrogenase [Alkaliphilus metalliredigens QYMF]
MTYDVLVLGGGPGGYVAAIKAAHLGGKVALVENGYFGGVCLNWGCIPTKALLKNARVYQDVLMGDFYGIEGIDKSQLSINWPAMLKRKDRIVRQLVGGVKGLLKKNKVDVFDGFGTLIDANHIEVKGQQLEGKKLIIATGTSPMIPDIPGLEASMKAGNILTSKELLSIEALPKSVVILGGGVIAIEFATLLNALDVEVTVIQRSDRILKGVEEEMALTLSKDLIKRKVKIVTNSSVEKIEGTRVFTKINGEEEIFEGDKILLSLGTSPNVKGLEALSLDMDKKGIITNDKMETSITGVYAIGDVNGKYQLAHVASAEGIVAAENAMGGNEELNYNIVPSCIYSFPEIASVGLTEEEARQKDYDVVVSKFPLAANGKAMAEGENIGFVKIIADKKYGEILGTHIMAVHATDMISEAIVSMQLEGTAYDVAKAIHPHPTMSEIVMEAAHGIMDQPIHF